MKTKTLDRIDDVVGGLGPLEGRGRAVGGVERRGDGGFDRICAYAVREDSIDELISRRYCLDHLVGSRIPAPGNPPGEDNIGFAGEPDLPAQHPLQWQDPNFDDVLRLMLRRVTVCPSDYNRDGIQNVNNDPNLFFAGVQLGDPYADWNFDTVLDGLSPTGLDGPKFLTPFQVMQCP